MLQAGTGIFALVGKLLTMAAYAVLCIIQKAFLEQTYRVVLCNA